MLCTGSAILEDFQALECDRVILACTELSAYKDWHPVPGICLDAMDILARRCVEACGYPLKTP